MIKIMILEDEQEHADRLMAMLGRYQESHPDFDFTAAHYRNPVLLLTDYQCDADILFLDIQVPDMWASMWRKRSGKRTAG